MKSAAELCSEVNGPTFDAGPAYGSRQIDEIGASQQLDPTHPICR
jgi:hypothetical protein